MNGQNCELGEELRWLSVTELEGVDAAATLLGHDLLGLGSAGQQKRRDRRRNGGGDLGDQMLGDHAGPAGHLRNEAEGGRAGADGESRLLFRRDAAHLHARDRGR